MQFNPLTGNFELSSGTSVAVKKIRRHEYIFPNIYCGTATEGTLDLANSWKLTKIVLDNVGTVISTETATDSWDNRVTATYTEV